MAAVRAEKSGRAGGRRRLPWVAGSLAAAAVLAVYGAAERYGLNPHGDAARCQSCHAGPPAEGLAAPAEAPASAEGNATASKGSYPLRYGRERAVCERCHLEHNQQTHPVEVKPRMALPAGRPLDSEGRLMCSTCHDPHRSVAASPQRHLLRGRDDGPRLCQGCHGDLAHGDSRAWHRVVVQSAHAAVAEGRTATAGGLDPLSARCLECHDGTVAPSVGMRTGQRRLDVGLGATHPVGVRYPAAGELPRRGKATATLRPIAQLDPRLHLVDGKVGCGTCHNLYATNPKLLAIDPRSGRLCRSCHDL